MNPPMLALTAADVHDDWWKQVAPSRNEFGLLFVAAAIVTLAAVIWAIFIRKRERTGSSRYTYPRVSKSDRNGAPTSEPGTVRHMRRKRKRRHRRNPTLAETGGLPPIRSESLPDDPP